MPSKVIDKTVKKEMEILIVELSNSHFGKGVTHINFYIGTEREIYESVDRKFKNIINLSAKERTLGEQVQGFCEALCVLEKAFDSEDLANKERKRIIGTDNFLSYGGISFRGNDLPFMNKELNYIGGSYHTGAVGYEEALVCATAAAKILYKCVKKESKVTCIEDIVKSKKVNISKVCF